MARICWKCDEPVNPTSHECANCRTPAAFTNSPYASGFYEGHCDAERDWKDSTPGASFQSVRNNEPRNKTPQVLADYEQGYVLGYNKHWTLLTNEDRAFDFPALA